MKHVMLIGRLTDNIEVTYSDSQGEQLAVGKFRLAVNPYKKDDKYDEPIFFNCVVFGTRAEALSRCMGKGQRLSVIGELKQHTYNEKKYLTVNVETFHFLDSARKDGE